MKRNSAVVYDASVLFSSSLRDLLIQLGVYAVRAKLFRPKWTEQINDEWTRNVITKYPNIKLAALKRTRVLMNKSIRDCLVTEYEHLIDDIDFLDLNDRHVVAAGKECKARIIVTNNLNDFPDEELKKHGLIAMTPDDFLMTLMEKFEDGEEILVETVKSIQKRLQTPPLTWGEYLSILANPNGPKLERSVARLKKQILTC